MRNHFASVAGQIHEQVKFFWSKVDSAILDKNAAGSRIDFEVAG